MGDITIQESKIDLNFNRTGKIAILMYTGDEDPVETLDRAVSIYVGNESYHEFIDINMDNPWVRVIISELNEMEQRKFEPSQDRLKS
jgi:hypothetical protein